ncbi:MAG TPA: YafY family protein [Verrucomicrobiae bacterium]|nr:YafY family protein [Verrucomicrobiae bacterium]
MNRVDRLFAIALHLHSRRVVRAEDLAGHFEISVRTVYRDIAALSEAGIPITGEAGVGYSLAKGHHLPPAMFTTEEASALLIAGKLVERLTDASLRKHMDSALLKVRSVLPCDRRDYLERLERSTAVVPRCSSSVPCMPSQSLIPIQRALAERRVLALDYRGGQSGKVTKRAVEPLGLVYYSDNWHLIAYCRLRRDVRDFRTDRVLKLELERELFSGHADFSLAGYLEQRQARKGEFVMVRIRFQPAVLERVRREWNWGLVEEKPEPNGVVVTLLDSSLEWLAGWVLSFGTAAEVLSPDPLKQLMVAEAGRIAALYIAPGNVPSRLSTRTAGSSARAIW